MIIIGITGTIGAGKGTIVEYLIQRYQFSHFSVRQYLTNILMQKKIEVNRDTMTVLANGLRQEHKSPSFIIEELYHLAHTSGKNCIIESIRTVGEIHCLREIGNFFLLAIDAPQAIRYQRIGLRKSATDLIDFDTFVQNENREMENSDENKQNIAGCLRLADYVLSNDGPLESLHLQIDGIIQKILENGTN